MTLRPTGTLNFRDVGGLPAAPGRRIRHGLLYRSDTLQFLTPQDVELLVDRLGLRTEIDLRRDAEVTREGRGLLGDTAVVHAHFPLRAGTMLGDVPVLPDPAARQDPARQDADADVPLTREEHLIVDHYVRYLTNSPVEVAGALRTLAAPDALPALVHCAAGKDRTGVTIAFALAVAGVEDDLIAAEYAAEPENIPRVVERLRGLPGYAAGIEALAPEANLTPPEYMLGFLSIVRQRFGGVEEWLLANGLTPGELEGLAAALTEPG